MVEAAKFDTERDTAVYQVVGPLVGHGAAESRDCGPDAGDAQSGALESRSCTLPLEAGQGDALDEVALEGEEHGEGGEGGEDRARHADAVVGDRLAADRAAAEEGGEADGESARGVGVIVA